MVARTSTPQSNAPLRLCLEDNVPVHIQGLETSARKEQTVPFTLANSQALFGGHQPAFAQPRDGYLEGVSHVQGQVMPDFTTLRSVMVKSLHKCSRTFWLTFRVASAPLFLACTRTNGPQREDFPSLSACRGHPRNPAIKVALRLMGESSLHCATHRKGSGAGARRGPLMCMVNSAPTGRGEQGRQGPVSHS